MDAEIAAHAQTFRTSLATILASNVQAVTESDTGKLDDAYARLTSLQAWRSCVLEEVLPTSCLGFYSEAQNDGLTSLVLVAGGLWRPSLKSLRSLIENVLHCIYYKDHPVEYRHWEAGAHRPSFQKLFEYFEQHPDLNKLPASLRSVPVLQMLYKNLSNVVHASAKELRMTDDLNQSVLWKTDQGSIGKWSSTFRDVLCSVNLLLLPIFKEDLQGAAHMVLRKSLSIVVPASKDGAVISELGVRIIR